MKRQVSDARSGVVWGRGATSACCARELPMPSLRTAEGALRRTEDVNVQASVVTSPHDIVRILDFIHRRI